MDDAELTPVRTAVLGRGPVLAAAGQQSPAFAIRSQTPPTTAAAATVAAEPTSTFQSSASAAAADWLRDDRKNAI